ALDRLFSEARTHSAWLCRPVTDDQLRRMYDLMKRGPTSANSSRDGSSSSGAGQRRRAGTGARAPHREWFRAPRRIRRGRRHQHWPASSIDTDRLTDRGLVSLAVQLTVKAGAKLIGLGVLSRLGRNIVDIRCAQTRETR